MLIPVTLLLLFIGSTTSKKQGDFGIFTACFTSNDSLRLTCHYAPCFTPTPFHCEFVGLPSNKDNCSRLIPEHRRLYRNVTTNYTCILTRRGRQEEKSIIINYSIKKGRGLIKSCPGGSGRLRHQTSVLLLPVGILSLWNVVDPDRWLT